MPAQIRARRITSRRRDPTTAQVSWISNYFKGVLPEAFLAGFSINRQVELIEMELNSGATSSFCWYLTSNLWMIHWIDPPSRPQDYCNQFQKAGELTSIPLIGDALPLGLVHSLEFCHCWACSAVSNIDVPWSARNTSHACSPGAAERNTLPSTLSGSAS